MEFRIKINNNISLKRDLGDYLLKALSTNLITNSFTQYIKKPVDTNTKPVTKRPLRLAAKKARLTVKACC